MEDTNKTIHECCSACLLVGTNLKSYAVNENSLFLQFWKVSCMTFCNHCNSIARICDDFLQNVDKVQKNLNAIALTLEDTSFILETVKADLKPLNNIEIKQTSVDLNISKAQIKLEDEIAEEDLQDESYDFEECKFDKSEDFSEDTNLRETKNMKLKVEVTFDEENIKPEPIEQKNAYLRKSKRKKNPTKVKNEPFMNKPKLKENSKLINVRPFKLTQEQYFEQKNGRLHSEKYRNSIFKCNFCVVGFSYKETFDKHMEKHDVRRGSVICNLCHQRFPKKSVLNNHIKNHLKRYECTLCKHVSTTTTAARDHYNAAHSLESVYSCQLCDKIFLKKIYLKAHFSYKHSNRERLVCDLCQKSFSNKLCLRLHMSNKHSSGKESKMDRPFCCPHCTNRYKHPTHLKHHLLSHSDDKNFYCVECDRYFKSAGSLKTHLMTTLKHTDITHAPNKCLECPKRFFDKRTLQAHMNREHFKTKPFLCDICEKGFLTPTSLQGHKKKVHSGKKPEKNIPCHMCTKVFQSKSILIDHIRTHTGERPFQCELCSATFTQSGSLHNHKKLVHLKLKRLKLHKDDL